MFQNSMQMRDGELRSLGISKNVTDLLTGSSAAANVAIIGTLSNEQQKEAVKEAYAWSLRNMWIMYTVCIACGIVASLFIRPQVLNKEHTETKTGLRKEKVEAQGAELVER